MNHSLQFVTDVASAGMKHIVGLLSGALVHHFFFLLAYWYKFTIY